MSPTTRATSIVLFVFLLGSDLVNAVVIRRDDLEQGYLDLAAKREFQAGQITVRDGRGDYTGVLIGERHILTVGHPIFGHLPEGESNGPLQIKVRFQDKEYDTEYAYLHPKYDRVAHHGGADLAIIRLKSPGIAQISPTTIFSGRVTLGETFVGIGQGKSGTGKDNDEPKPMGTFRGYENTIDYIFDKEEFAHFRSDFDDGTDEYNTLERVVYGPKNLMIKGKSSRTPLPLEGTTAAGDSGSGIWIQRNKKYHLAGIASYRYFSMYGGQAGYVNLSHPANINWIRAVSLVENVSFEIMESKK